MEKETIIEVVNGLLAEEFEVEQGDITPDANVKETLSLDSISLVDLMALVQQQFRVTIPLQDLPKIQTFDNLYDYIFSHQPEA